MVKFAYIVANYFGGRHSENTHDSTYYLRRHLEFLRRHDIDELELSIMVINIQTDKDIKQLSDSIRELPIEKQNKIQIINRKNIDGSYGAWEDGIIWLINNRPDIEYAMLIEDDYIPVRGDFLQLFYEHFEPDAAFVCQIFSAGGAGHNFLPHPHIANGMIDLSKAVEVYKNTKQVFVLNRTNSERNTVCHDQETYLDHFSKWRIVDTSEHWTPFKRIDKWVDYGGTDDPILLPM